MHELASMAAKKAEELHLPPPPADFTTPAPTPTDKVEGEKDGSTSESSLESSSGYGSQTTIPVDDSNHQEGKILNFVLSFARCYLAFFPSEIFFM